MEVRGHLHAQPALAPGKGTRIPIPRYTTGGAQRRFGRGGGVNKKWITHVQLHS